MNYYQSIIECNQILKLIKSLPTEAWVNLTEETQPNRSEIMREVIKLYDTSSSRLKKLAEDNTLSLEYCRGNVMHMRGYYCPDPLTEVIVSNDKRGSLMKKTPLKRPYFIYHLDKDGELIMIENRGAIGGIFTQTELLVRFDNIRVGFSFVEGGHFKERALDVCLEFKVDNRYSISRYCGYKMGLEYYMLDSVESNMIEFEKGLPVRRTDITQYTDLDPDLKELWEMSGNTSCKVYEILYDESGLPNKGKVDGNIFEVGSIKKLVTKGMM